MLPPIGGKIDSGKFLLAPTTHIHLACLSVCHTSKKGKKKDMQGNTSTRKGTLTKHLIATPSNVNEQG